MTSATERRGIQIAELPAEAIRWRPGPFHPVEVADPLALCVDVLRGELKAVRELLHVAVRALADKERELLLARLRNQDLVRELRAKGNANAHGMGKDQRQRHSN